MEDLMISQELQASLHTSLVEARQQRHEFITVEHLLLALVDNLSAREVLEACAADIDGLRKELTAVILENTPTVGGSDEVDTQPTLGFQRVIQRAVMHVQCTGGGKREVTGANVLVAVFGEKDSHAVYWLHQQSITRLDVVNYIAHGIRRDDARVRPLDDDEHDLTGTASSELAASDAADRARDAGVGLDVALRLRQGTHVLLSDIRRMNSHRALLTAEGGCCIVLSVNEGDDGLTLYTQEQVQAIRSEAGLARAARAVCLAWKEDHGADALRRAIEALERTLES
jgi:hypothetical protein